MPRTKRSSITAGLHAGSAQVEHQRHSRRKDFEQDDSIEEILGMKADPSGNVASDGLGPQKSDAVPKTRPEAGKSESTLKRPATQNRARSLSRDDVAKPEKPAQSFSTLIKEAILKSPNQRLLLQEIYEAIQTAYPYFQTAGDGWKNSIRHNLSINSMFCKIPRAVLDDPNAPTDAHLKEESGKGRKKGCYWVIRDLSSLAEARFTAYERQRRHSMAFNQLATARSGLFTGQGDCIRILPFTHVPSVIDIGRRFSDSTDAKSYPGEILTLESLRNRPSIKDQLELLHAAHPRSPYDADITVDPDERPLVDIQPLAIEEGDESLAGMEWFATSPTLAPDDPAYVFFAPVTMAPIQSYDESYGEGEPSLRVRRASQVGPFTLPRRDPTDIFLGEIGTPTHGGQEKPSQFRQ